jgi:carbamate kinase
MSKYCIVATCKTTNIRKRISPEYDNKEQAERNLKNYTDSISRRAFKYAKVVKSPYTPCKGGEGWCH